MRKEKYMWKYLNRAGALALTMVLALGSMTGCGPGKETTDSKTSSEQSSESSKKYSSEKSSESTSESSEKESGSTSTSESVETLGIKNASSYIKKMADYGTIKIEKAKIDKQLQERINSLLEQYPSAEQITSGKVKSGDTVNIYYVGKINGEEFEGGSCTKETQPDGYDLEIGSGTFIAGFEDSLIGKEIGKTVDINVTFPENYSSDELAGKDAVFTVSRYI